MIRSTYLGWFGLVLASGLPACSGTPMSLGSGTDEVVSSTDDGDEPTMTDDGDEPTMTDDGDEPTMTDDGDEPTMTDDGDPEIPDGGCLFDGVYYENGEPLPKTDCNSRWCQDGNMATTLVQCPMTEDECDAALAACNMEGTSMTCAQEYDACMRLLPPDLDMCEAAVQACIDGGEDAMTCVGRYNCGAETEPQGECEAVLAACNMEGTSMTCEQEYNACIGQMVPALGPCESSVQQCIESGEDAMRCVTRFNCDGPPTSEDECENIQAECAMNADTLCDELYAACISRLELPSGLDMCAAAIETCVANGESEAACQMRYAGCGGAQATPQDCEAAYTYCQSSTMSVGCDETYDACMQDAEPLTASECQAEFEMCQANGMSMSCTQDYDICISYAVE